MAVKDASGLIVGWYYCRLIRRPEEPPSPSPKSGAGSDKV